LPDPRILKLIDADNILSAAASEDRGRLNDPQDEAKEDKYPGPDLAGPHTNRQVDEFIAASK